MQERRRWGLRAVSAAMVSSQPDKEHPAKPAVAKRSQSRRDKLELRRMGGSF
jgi:hypothetical protein